MNKLTDYSIRKVSFGEKDYPELLSKISKPPKQIYYRGGLNNGILTKTIAIVGTRMITNYGKQVIDEFIAHFVANGITVISGFMYGVDTEVHTKTIEYGGQTISVFGNGLDYIYPPENEKLYAEILENGGVVISEYKEDAKPQLWTYPARNRIVAALSSVGVLVIEADLESGSLITAKIAKEQGKKVWAIPGPITSKVSRGTNFLIKNSDAIMAINPSDITGKSTKLEKKSSLELTGIEAEIYAKLENESLSIDELAFSLNKNVIELGGTLTMMSLKGIVSEVGGKFYANKS